MIVWSFHTGPISRLAGERSTFRGMADRLDISQRKKDHLALCAGDNVNFREKTSLFEQVELVHCALPEMHADAVDSRVELLGKRLVSLFRPAADAHAH